MSKSLCIDARLLTSPGIGTYLKNLLPLAKETPWKWYALVYAGQIDEFSHWGHIDPIVVSSGIYSIKEQIELPLKIPSVDLFWSPHFNIPCLPIRVKKRLISIHDAFHFARASSLTLMERLYSKFMMQKAMRYADHAITFSSFSKGEIQRFIKNTKCSISIIPHGVDSALFQCVDQHSSNIIEKKYGIGHPFLLYVGTYKAHKNLKGLIAAFSQLIRQWSIDVHLVIVGGGQGMRHCDDVKQLCIAYPELQNKMHCVGRVPDADLPHFYRKAQAFVFPSFYEGFGFSPLEAMSSGCPVVVSRSGGLPEVCGDAALYIDPHATDAIAQQLAQLLKDPAQCRDLAQRGLEQSKLFCWKKSARQHFAVIEELIHS